MTKYDFTELLLLKQVVVRYKCSACLLLKGKVSFGEQNTRKSGVRHKCKTCDAEYSRSYAKTKDGLITKIYGKQKSSSKHRGHSQPSYSKLEFREWCLSQDVFHELYENWVTSGYKKSSVPSVDRIDDYKGYGFDNIQLMTWLENNNKGNSDEASGRNRKRSKAIDQYDLNGVFLRRYYSSNQASTITGISREGIRQVCLGKPMKKGCRKDGTPIYNIPRTAGGYIWKYV